jgi:hypothetical protein
MDLNLFIRVLWRFRLAVAGGFLLALVLAFLALNQVSLGSGGITTSPRGSEVWEAKSVVLLTQSGFPYGRAVPEYTSPSDETTPPVQLGDQSRFSALSQIYTGMANSDKVRARVAREVPVRGSVNAEATPDPVSGQPLPLLTLTATAPTAADAATLAQGATRVFRDFVSRQQTDAGIPDAERIQLEVLDNGAAPILAQPRKKTLAMLVFVAVMMATLALVFVLENLRPRTPGMARHEVLDPDDELMVELATMRVSEREHERKSA